MTIFELQKLLQVSNVFSAFPGTVPVKSLTDDTFIHISTHWRTCDVRWNHTIRIDIIPKKDDFQIGFIYGSDPRRISIGSRRHNLKDLTPDLLLKECEINLKNYSKFQIWKTQIYRNLRLEEILS